MCRSSIGIGAVVLIALLAPAASAQTVRGVVRQEEASGVIISGVQVELITLDDSVAGRAVSGSRGRFVLGIPSPGRYRLRASQLGYRVFISEVFDVESDQGVRAEVHMALAPVELDALEVFTEGRVQSLSQVGFYRRSEQGFGHFLTPDDIEARHARKTTELLRGIPGVQLIRDGPARSDVILRGGQNMFIRQERAGGGPPEVCWPSIAIDGQVVRRGLVTSIDSPQVGRWSDLIHPNDVEGVEVYRGGAGLPPLVAGSISPCGAVLIWTRR